MKLLTTKEVLEIIHISYNSLLKLVKNDEIETLMIGNKRLYNLDKYLLSKGIINKIVNEKKNISYCRVSSLKQKEDLTRQISYMKTKYPENIIISEIGSGLNNNRKGFKKIIDYAIKGKINTLVVSYRDRLCRFGFELIEYIIKKYSNGKIIVLNKKMSIEEKLTEDILTIMNVYVAKINGIRSHKNRVSYKNVKRK